MARKTYPNLGVNEPASFMEKALAKRNAWKRHQPSLSSQLSSMWREAVKDIRATLMESYFGKPEHMAEPGAPGVPTQQQVTADQGNFHGYDFTLEEAGRRPTGQDNDRGITR